MTRTAAAPLPVLYLPPPEPGMLADLLLHEVAACVAAVGHRLHVLPPPRGTVPDAVAQFAADQGREPVVVVLGLLEAGPGTPPPSATVHVVTVTLDGIGPPEAGPEPLALPTRSRSLCRLLARGNDRRLPGRAVVLAHHGDGAGGDDGWPGLSWGLALLLGGPGRGVLVDLRGPEGGLASRLRAVSDRIRPESAGYAGSSDAVPGSTRDPVPDPVPGPALASRLPAAGAVRWWSRSGSTAEVLPVLGAAVDTFEWTVLDVGRDAPLAAELAAQGLPALSVTDRDGACWLEPVPRNVGPSAARIGDRLALEPSLWTGTTPASWARAARRRVCLDLAVRLTTLLSRDLAEVR